MFYQLITESVLPYGSNSWCLLAISIHPLDIFQTNAGLRLTGIYDAAESQKRADVLAATSLKPLYHYTDPF